MTVRALHVHDDLLSAYLDGALRAPEARELEDHLATCPGCQARLDGLRRVVGALARLERAAPPPLLARQVERRVILEGRRAGLTERLENRLQGLTLQSPMVVAFTVVLALAVILYVFAQGLARQEPLLVPVRGAAAGEPGGAGAGAGGARAMTGQAEAGENEAGENGAGESGAEESGAEENGAGEADREEPEARSDVPVLIGGRTFVVRDGLWHEQAVGTRETELRVTADEPAGRDLLERHPWLERLLAARPGVVLLEDERVIELRPAADADAEPEAR